MHELSITEALLEVVLRHAGGARVLGVDVTVGAWTGYAGGSIDLFWRELARGTCAEGAALRFRVEAATLKCRACGCVFLLDGSDLLCPQCGGAQALPEGGKDCTVDAIEIEGEGSP